ncbi:MAG: hypothetical protein ACK2UY_01400 [Anaerolineae bacterium]|jgi:hypothetical protein
MNRNEERDLLVTYTDQILGLEPGPGPELTRHDRIRGLLALADHLQAILIPVQPDPDFRRRLHGDLLLEAQERRAEPQVSLFQQHRKGILIGAALGSLASVAGVVLAFVLRQRNQRAGQVASG